jgi:hypothetical protein
MDAKIKHLEFIQDAIKRMAGNSFLLRGWSITLVTAIFTLASQTYKPIYLWIAFFTTVIFWLLDSYYLSQERKFRCLYDDVRKKDQAGIDFLMTPMKNHCNKCKWYSSAKSPIFLAFYGLIITALIIILVTTYLNIVITLK